jgi:autotransporter passenger strand-loop-strand repeat protein
MTTITVSSYTIVSSATGDSYIVEDSNPPQYNATLEVASGGTVSGLITISSGGHLNVDSGGVTLMATVNSGGSVSDAGEIFGTTIVAEAGDTLEPGKTLAVLPAARWWTVGRSKFLQAELQMAQRSGTAARNICPVSPPEPLTVAVKITSMA